MIETEIFFIKRDKKYEQRYDYIGGGFVVSLNKKESVPRGVAVKSVATLLQGLSVLPDTLCTLLLVDNVFYFATQQLKPLLTVSKNATCD